MDQPPVDHLAAWKLRWQRAKASLKKGFPFITGILATLVALVVYNVIRPAPHTLTNREINTLVSQALASATPPPPYSERVYQAIHPSLVAILVKSQDAEGKNEDGLGSGVVIDDQGDILTSLHVVAGASDIQLIFPDGTQTSGQVMDTQPENDIAVLRADQPPAQLVPATLGNPRAMEVGDEAYVVGNPFGLYSSLSAGVISGFNRTFKTHSSDQELKGLIQVDAAVNPGNSGGPLLNRYGEVVGIVTGILNPTEQNFFVGIGFAVPINVATSGMGSPPY